MSQMFTGTNVNTPVCVEPNQQLVITKDSTMKSEARVYRNEMERQTIVIDAQVPKAELTAYEKGNLAGAHHFDGIEERWDLDGCKNILQVTHHGFLYDLGDDIKPPSDLNDDEVNDWYGGYAWGL